MSTKLGLTAAPTTGGAAIADKPDSGYVPPVVTPGGGKEGPRRKSGIGKG